MLDKILFLPCPLLLCLIEILSFISYIFLSNLNLPDYASWYECSFVVLDFMIWIVFLLVDIQW